MKAVFLDASVLISILQKEQFSQNILEILSQYDEFWISSVTYLFGYEKCRRMGLNSAEIHRQLSFYEIANVDSRVIQMAMSICQDSDFEDALQVSSANCQGVDVFLTSDLKLAKRYKEMIEIKLVQ